MRSAKNMTDNLITYVYPSPQDWRKHLLPDGVQLRIKTSDGKANGVAVFIIHADFIRETFGEGDPLKVARESSDAILAHAKQAVEVAGRTELNTVCHLYNPKKT